MSFLLEDWNLACNSRRIVREIHPVWKLPPIVSVITLISFIGEPKISRYLRNTWDYGGMILKAFSDCWIRFGHQGRDTTTFGRCSAGYEFESLQSS